MTQGFDVFLSPKSVAVIGATGQASQPGRAAIWNLINNQFGGTVYPIHPELKSILGIRAYRSLSAVPEPVDIALVAGAVDVTEAVANCIGMGVKGIIAGACHEGSISPPLLERARLAGIRILGPNSLGVMRPGTALNATFAPAMPPTGSVALVSQSAGICTSLIDWGIAHDIGFSAVVSLGEMVDIAWADVIDRLGSDIRTRSIVLYLETLGDARAFLSAVREVALDKPVVLIKGGEPADGVFEAAVRRVGVVQVRELNDIFTVTDVLAHQPAAQGPRLAIITNSGGPGMLAANALRLEDALAADATRARLEPVDLTQSAGAAEYQAAVTAAQKDRSVDGILVIHSPHAGRDRVEVAQMLASLPRSRVKPLIACWMGSQREGESEQVLSGAGIPTFPFPEPAARAFGYMWRFTDNVRAIYETPSLAGPEPTAISNVSAMLETAGPELTSSECERVLASCGIDVEPGPVEPPAYPFVLASYIDEVFGPVLSLSAGGPFEKLRRPAFALPPLNTTLARRLIEESEAHGLVCESALEPILVRSSRLILEVPTIESIRIELLAGSTVHVRSARVKLHRGESKVQRAAIRPYPSHYVSTKRLKDGTEIVVRPIRPEDEPALARFHKTLSDESVYLRYFAPLTLEHRISHNRLTRVCFIDYDRQIAFVAQPASEDEICGVGRLVKIPLRDEGELAAIVSDSYQQCGVGRILVQQLIQFARDERLTRVVAYVLAQNMGMRTLLKKAGFVFSEYDEPQTLEGVLGLSAP